MDIGGWLRGLGLERYEQAFRENEIDLRVLPELTADDLKELGVAAIGHRRLLLKAIAQLYDPAAATDDAETVAEFLARRFGGTPAVGDRTRFGAVELIVRDMQGDTIAQVGVELEPAPVHPWRFWLQRLRRRRG